MAEIFLPPGTCVTNGAHPGSSEWKLTPCVRCGKPIVWHQWAERPCVGALLTGLQADLDEARAATKALVDLLEEARR